MNTDLEYPLVSLLCVLVYVVMVILIFVSVGVRIVPEGKKLTVFRLGRRLGERGPGLVLLIPFIDRGIMSGSADVGAAASARYPVGAQGQAKTLVETRGEVLIDGVTWKATSAQSILPGARVRVKDVIVEVEME